MADQAKITSLDALELFRSNLIIFLTRSRNCLDSVNEEVRRTRMWVQSEQRMHWETEIRRRSRTLDQAKQDLLSARLATMRPDITHQINMVRKAEKALAEAEEKMRSVKRWTRDYDSQFDPRTKKLESLRHFLDEELAKANSLLVQIQKTLSDYAQTAPAEDSPAS